jgi:hypothetical protein
MINSKILLGTLTATILTPLLLFGTTHKAFSQTPVSTEVSEPSTQAPASDQGQARLLTLCVFGRFSEKLFVLFFVAGKAPVPVAFPQKQSTHFLHEVLWAKGFRVNSLEPPYYRVYSSAVAVVGA